MKLYSGACERNRDPILGVLAKLLPRSGNVLEIASGTGMHAVYFARSLPNIVWQPSDVEHQALASISAWRDEEPVSNLLAPIRLDMTERGWEIDVGLNEVHCIFNANMVHIAPWIVAQGLFRGASSLLKAGAPLVLYGPFRFAGRTAESNERFHESLRSRDPSWGVRDSEALCVEAQNTGFEYEACHALPANNHILVFRRR